MFTIFQLDEQAHTAIVVVFYCATKMTLTWLSTLCMTEGLLYMATAPTGTAGDKRKIERKQERKREVNEVREER